MPDRPARDTSAQVDRQRRLDRNPDPHAQDHAIDATVRPWWPQPNIPLPRSPAGDPIVNTQSAQEMVDLMLARTHPEVLQRRAQMAAIAAALGLK